MVILSVPQDDAVSSPPQPRPPASSTPSSRDSLSVLPLPGVYSVRSPGKLTALVRYVGLSFASPPFVSRVALSTTVRCTTLDFPTVVSATVASRPLACAPFAPTPFTLMSFPLMFPFLPLLLVLSAQSRAALAEIDVGDCDGDIFGGDGAHMTWCERDAASTLSTALPPVPLAPASPPC